MKFRYPFIKIVFDILELMKSNFLFIILIFIINANNDSTLIIILKYITLVGISVSLLLRIKETFFTSIEMKDDAFHIYTGIFSKTEQFIPRDKIENLQTTSTVLHRLFNAQQLILETGDSSTDITIKFVNNKQFINFNSYILSSPDEVETNSNIPINQEVVLFTPTTIDLLKASCMSLSFLAVIPLVFKGWTNFNLDEKVDISKVNSLFNTWIIIILFILLVLAAIGIGVVKTFKQYYHYKISMNDERIYIRKGLVAKQTLSIRKEKVQAVIFSQSLYQKILGVVTVKLLSAGEILSTNQQQINEFFPYLPKKNAFKLVEQMLPSYGQLEFTNQPVKKAKWLIVLRPPLFGIGCLALWFWKPIFLIVGGIVIICTYIYRIQQYKYSAISFKDSQIQLQTGGFTTETLITKRAKLLEISFAQSPMQKLINAQTITVTNRANPVQVTTLNDFDQSLNPALKRWFEQRKIDVILDPKSQPQALKKKLISKLLFQLKEIKSTD